MMLPQTEVPKPLSVNPHTQLQFLTWITSRILGLTVLFQALGRRVGPPGIHAYTVVHLPVLQDGGAEEEEEMWLLREDLNYVRLEGRRKGEAAATSCLSSQGERARDELLPQRPPQRLREVLRGEPASYPGSCSAHGGVLHGGRLVRDGGGRCF